MSQPTAGAPAAPKARSCPFLPPDGIADIRAAAPVTRATFTSGHEAWLVTGYEQVRAVLRDPSFSVGVPHALHTQDGVVTQKPGRGSLLWQDAPEHTDDRKLLAKEFTVRRMQALRPNIQRIVDEHLDAIEARGGPVDLVKTFANPVPSMVISDLFGVPAERRAEFQEIAEAMMRVDQDAAATEAAGMRLGGLLYQLVQERRANPGDDLISALITTEDPDGVIDDMFLMNAAGTLLIAAHDTTACMIGLGTALLLDRPDQLALLQKDPSLIGNAVEELLRYLTIGQFGAERVATQDGEIGGVRIAKGEQVVTHLLSADFDPAFVEDPERFDITRRPAPHLAFGFGAHQCIGQQLARIELQIVFGTLFRRFPTLRLAKPVEELRFRNDMVFYGVHELPVTW
ncbi:cytochrome P450 [Streptomyces xantholiticus]|uniref:Cytochrome P450 n=2 Tax=Streptomyces TaxID=1883 RepID=A0ABV1UUJ7_9ACTN|nr:Chain A, Putative cytochrome P450 [Streptomyces peucetius]5IT1_B Chain B, Putative cytochrome P450 [Streptomyces peucetius]5IT1_C Chain C, Putative cytochrome P450 [Streptomyces peucetius]5IT1_D Chain D, Putative cytochrome P450 [Streptomyces peucetius]ATW51260.1 cytochrome P450 [Streptomyces peucetius subsp. caesius ATCC 27952]CAE53708.1 putative cytochrome P450 [Streptomyces peucetius subsp. caesius ATCC 27952]